MALTRMILDVEMEDGTLHEDIKTNIADQMLYSKQAKMKKWGSVTDDPLTFINFMAFAALSRLGKYTKGFDDFCNEAGAVGESESGPEGIDPSKAVR
ncbi:hypothetical protein [Rhodococcus sp. IEGM 1318]|uniref:hypothetical protein n=1 Tax=Rhodococcus sp. IEGM 1318 TaxID=3082226 RepID=UPI0029541C24|nr:hypothetical protein [Rhodococcus sp. IEGM 1318]MDV8003857.1 hypothetical protein [Rhodococcus sp. IEGM 1318]